MNCQKSNDMNIAQNSKEIKLCSYSSSEQAKIHSLDFSIII